MKANNRALQYVLTGKAINNMTHGVLSQRTQNGKLLDMIRITGNLTLVKNDEKKLNLNRKVPSKRGTVARSCLSLKEQCYRKSQEKFDT